MAQLNDELSRFGFQVLAFPTNDFHQEFNTNEEIATFWRQQFPEATFPIFGLSSLNDNPVYQRLRQHLPHDHVQHNFFKYLVNQDGIAVRMFSKRQNPSTLKQVIIDLIHHQADAGVAEELENKDMA